MLVAITLRSFLSSHTVLYIVLFVLLCSLLISIFIRPTKFPKSRLNIFITIMANVAVVLIGFSLVMSAFNLEEQEKVNKATFTKEAIDKLWLYPNKTLASSTNARPEFLASLYPNNLELYKFASQKEPTVETVASVIDEQYIAILMIQAWEDYLTLRNLDKTGDAVWLNNFLQWAQSPYLKHYFDFLKYNFKPTTIEIGNLLFDYAKKLPIPTPDPEFYRVTVLEMLKDSNVTDLLQRASR